MEKVFETIEACRMLEAGDQITAGVSGGADSVCLLFVLKQYLELHKELEIRLQAVHVEHGIRGGDSLADAEFVRELCESWDIPFLCVSCDVPALAAREKMTLEEAGRQARYAAFSEAAGEKGKIAVAHNAGDQAETILWNLARGSGIAGLCGMRPVRGRILRPLLYVTREEIEAYLRENGISWRIDRTNASLDYTRNRLRHQVIPALTGANVQAVRHIGEAGERLDQIFCYLAGQGKKWLDENESSGKAYAPEKNEPSGKTEAPEKKESSGKTDALQKEERPREIAFPVKKFREADPVLQDFILQEALERLGVGRKNLQAVHLESMKALAARQSGKRLENLPGNLEALILGERYVLRSRKKTEKEPEKEPGVLPLSVPGEVRYGNYVVKTLLEPAKNEIIPEKKYTKWFDYDTIKDTIQLRNRRPGDYLTIAPDCRRKKLKQYFIDEKIPLEQRSQTVLLASGSQILWVIGGRISESFKVTSHTKNILKVQIREVEHGR